ncbi:myosin XV-like protein, partial [Leptotrombidium deliense]
ILRFMNDNNLSGQKERVLANYIVQKGLANEALRDEILCQLCNQTHKNDNDSNNERGWLLMASCLSCFHPSTLLFKYLLKYVSDNGFDGFKSVCQKKLLQSERVERENCRTYPPSLLEWKSNMKKSNMALKSSFFDGDTKYAAVESWSTCEQFAADALKAKGFDDPFGWTVDLDDSGDIYGLNGNDYVLDVISQMEIPPSFPVCNSYFLNSADRSKSGGKQKILSSAHNPERVNKLDIDIGECSSLSNKKSSDSNERSRVSTKKISVNGELRAKSVSREHLIGNGTAHANQVDESENTVIPSMNLSRSSRLNQRYLHKETSKDAPNIKLSATSKLNQRYICSQTEPTTNDESKLSESKSLSKRSMSLQELGLACSALNDRYFASRQNLHKTSSLTGDSEHLDQLSKVASTFSLQDHSRVDVESNTQNYKPESPLRKPHLIRPSSRSSSSSLSSSVSPGDMYSNTTVDESELSNCNRDKSNEMNNRYVKYSGRPIGGQSRYPPYTHCTKASIDRSANRDLDFCQAPRSSGLSDTSEAPSLASHVKNVKIPSHTSDLDQYLDDLFNPVLDGNLDELSDARSLAASIKGGSNDNLSYCCDANEYRFHVFDEVNEDQLFVQQVNDCFTTLNVDTSDVDALGDVKKLVYSLKGGGNDQLQSTITFGTNNATEAIPNASGISPNVSSPFTNIAGMTVPMVDTSQIIQQQLVHQQMIQRAFLASAVQQNLQIQQQLLQQNQALQQLLNSAVSPNSTNISSEQLSVSPTLPMLSPILEPLLQTVNDHPNFSSHSLAVISDSNNEMKNSGAQQSHKSENQNDVFSIINCNNANIFQRTTQGLNAPPPPPPPPPPSPPPLSPNSSYADVYGRAKTVRIGKWRWPPPRDEVATTTATSFLEFKLKRQQEKTDKTGDFDRYDEPNLTLLAEIQKNEENRKEKSRGEKMKSFAVNDKLKENVGKLRISSEMKAKLEQLTIDQSVRSNKKTREKLVRSLEDIRESGVKKLSEHRKALLERQLMGSMKTLSEVGINHTQRDNVEFKINCNEPHTKLHQTRKQDEHIDNLRNSHFSERFSASRRSGSRESRERRDELGPHNRSNTAASTINAECGDYLSQSAGNTFFDDASLRNSIAYEESINSSIRPSKSSRDVDSFVSKPVKRMSVPPPPPPTAEFLKSNSTDDHSYQFARQGPPSVAASSSFCGQTTPIVVRRKELPAAPVNFKMALDRLSLDRLEFIESSEFLNPIKVPPLAAVERLQQQAAANIKTKLYPHTNSYHLTYSNVHWRLNIRKEVSNVYSVDSNILRLRFEDITEVLVPRNCTLQLLLHTGVWLTLYTYKAIQIRQLIEKFIFDVCKSEAEFVKAVSDHNAVEPSLLNFCKGSIIRLVSNKNLHIAKGWLYGILESGESGIFPCEYVVPLSKDEMIKLKQKMDEIKKSLRSGLNSNENDSRYDLAHNKDGSLNGTIKFIESLKSKKKNKKSKNGDGSDWTWKELSDLVKYSKTPLSTSLLKLHSPEMTKLSNECFLCIMRFMGDYSLSKNQTEVDCVYAILMNCHKYPELRDELYCQIIKQTTNNKSLKAKTLKYGGRRNVPSIEEVTAISAGRNSKRQIYRLPGGSERVVNTKSSTVVADVIEEICEMLGVTSQLEMEEFSLYCIIEGDPYTMPLNKDEYILDVTTELLKNDQVFYLIFCRSVWFHCLRLDNQLYIEVIFNQVAPDYLEGLLLVTPNGRLPQEMTVDISRIAALLHRAADMEHNPTKDEVKYLLPKPVLPMKEIRPPVWVEKVQQNWSDMAAITTTEAKAQCLDILQKWPLFGSCFFAVKETVWKYPYSEVISTRKVRAEDGTLFLDMKCGNLMVQKITRIQTDQAHEISRLIRQYINIQSSGKDMSQDINLSRSTAQINTALH